MRRNVLRRDHVLGDALTHDGHRLHFVIAEVDALARHGGLERDVMLAAGARWRRSLRRRLALRRRWRRRVARRWGLLSVNVGLGWFGLLRGFGSGAAAGEVRFDVLLADAATRASSLHGGEVDAVLLRHAANERRAVNPCAFACGSGFRSGGTRVCGWGRGGGGEGWRPV